MEWCLCQEVSNEPGFGVRAFTLSARDEIANATLSPPGTTALALRLCAPLPT